MELMEKVLGLEHPSILDGMNNLAIVLDSQGKYTGAEQMHRQVLKMYENPSPPMRSLKIIIR
jgi:uncharacterized protein HemY